MKVLCIQEPISCSPEVVRDGIKPIVKEGETYTVIAEEQCIDDGSIAYELAEHIGCFYHSRLFIPLSGKDETEYADEVLTRMFQPVKF